GDYVFAKTKTETATTVTAQAFPDPIQTIKTKTSDIILGEGAQAGVGIKFMIYKHLYLYAEAPMTLITEKTTNEIEINDTGTLNESKATVRNTYLQFYVPTTIYVLLRF